VSLIGGLPAREAHRGSVVRRLYRTGTSGRSTGRLASDHHRIKEMIKVRGFQGCAGRIETVLHGHPASGTVAVFGVPDGPTGNGRRCVARFGPDTEIGHGRRRADLTAGGRQAASLQARQQGGFFGRFPVPLRPVCVESKGALWMYV